MQGLSTGTQGLHGLFAVYVDDLLLVLDKPAGLLCVPGRGEDKQDCLSSRAQRRWPDAQVVHRLDMATSGLCAMARGEAAQRRLSIDFAQRRVDKRYEAVVGGMPAGTADWNEIDLPLAADWPNRPRQQVSTLHGKPSRTRWRLLGQGPLHGTARLELEPVTGRTHQLRVHLAAIGHPIVGDALYAPGWPGPRLMLHATRLGLPHPASGEAMQWHSPCPF